MRLRVPVLLRLTAFLLLFLAPCRCAFLRAGDLPEATFRSTVAEVQLTFFSADERQRTVSDLKAQDFAIVDNENVVRNFRSFMGRDLTKVRVVILVDSSESVRPRYHQEIREVLRLIGGTSWISGDSISVLAFSGTQLEKLCHGNCREHLSSSDEIKMRAQGTTPLYDALVRGAEAVSKEHDPGLMRVMIVFSDGVDTISLRSVNEVLDASRSRELQIYAVDVNETGSQPEGSAMLHALAEATGGRYFPKQEAAVGVLQGMLEDLHAAYVVTYVPPERSPGTHRVRILPTHNLNFHFRCRSSYEYDRNP